MKNKRNLSKWQLFIKKNWINVLPLALLVPTLVMAFQNWINSDFWDASAVQLMTPLGAVCLTFFATQLKSDQREAKKHAEMIAEKIQLLVLDESFYIIKNDSLPEKQNEIKKQIQMRNRKTSNNIQNLIAYSKLLDFQKEAEYIETQFDSYRQLIDDHLTNIDVLAGLEVTFRKHAENIGAKCDEIIVKLYT